MVAMATMKTKELHSNCLFQIKKHDWIFIPKEMISFYHIYFCIIFLLYLLDLICINLIKQ